METKINTPTKKRNLEEISRRKKTSRRKSEKL
jgi:hypothetical protein